MTIGTTISNINAVFVPEPEESIIGFGLIWHRFANVGKEAKGYGLFVSIRVKLRLLTFEVMLGDQM